MVSTVSGLLFYIYLFLDYDEAASSVIWLCRRIQVRKTNYVKVMLTRQSILLFILFLLLYYFPFHLSLNFSILYLISRT